MNEKEKALQLFRSQIEELDLLACGRANAWKNFTVEIIKRYLGNDSAFINLYTNGYPLLNQKYEFSKDLILCRQNLEKCIQFIESHGVLMPIKPVEVKQVKQPKSNFISRMSEGWAIFWTGCLVSVFGLGGYSIGEFKTQQKIDQQKIELTNEVAKLKSQNSILRMRLTDKPAKKEGGHTKQPNSK